MSKPVSSVDAAAVREWIVQYLAQVLQIDPRHVDLGKSLGELGLDSVDALILAGELEEHFGVEVEPTAVFEFKSFQGMLDAWGRGGRAG